MGLVGVGAIRYGVVAREEAYLERKFGDTFLAYKARVGAGSRSEVMLTLIVYRRLCSALSVGRRSPSLRLAKLGLPPRGPR